VGLDFEPDGIDLWAYDRHRPLDGPAHPPDQVRRVVAGASMVWNGREVVIASAQTAQDRTITRAGRYDPDRAGWTPIAPPPRPGGRVHLPRSRNAGAARR